MRVCVCVCMNACTLIAESMYVGESMYVRVYVCICIRICVLNYARSPIGANNNLNAARSRHR